MVRITLDLIRKRAEHNNMEISTLVEVSLHQQNIERIELLDQACRELQILYLQNNLIGKIENVGRLKELRYLNLALNNIQTIENLQGCENLSKLDLTVNFIGNIESIASLKENRCLAELYLSGNPCTHFDRYRDYVVCMLPQLRSLDGTAIEKSDRIKAMQSFEETKKLIHNQVEAYRRDLVLKNKSRPAPIPDADFDPDDPEKMKKFWEQETDYTPESRLEIYRKQEEIRLREEEKKNPKKEVKPRALHRDGKPLNVNEANVEFTLTGHEYDASAYLLDLACPKFMDTSLLDVDVQPTHVKVVIKGKLFQLVLPEEVLPDSSSAQRSQVTGHLLVTMPKAKPVISTSRANSAPNKISKEQDIEEKGGKKTGNEGRELLEVGQGTKAPGYATIIEDNEAQKAEATKKAFQLHSAKKAVAPRDNDPSFVDNDDVPPLE